MILEMSSPSLVWPVSNRHKSLSVGAVWSSRSSALQYRRDTIITLVKCRRPGGLSTGPLRIIKLCIQSPHLHHATASHILTNLPFCYRHSLTAISFAALAPADLFAHQTTPASARERTDRLCCSKLLFSHTNQQADWSSHFLNCWAVYSYRQVLRYPHRNPCLHSTSSLSAKRTSAAATPPTPSGSRRADTRDSPKKPTSAHGLDTTVRSRAHGAVRRYLLARKLGRCT
ncbi:hypothetical protein LXA43DRAFT_153169 [Ganoderma leucocontextum]|nr:hypothetical protein LXA43DRAFT_153169 [Ganoderma leucocontextum]